SGDQQQKSPPLPALPPLNPIRQQGLFRLWHGYQMNFLSRSLFDHQLCGSLTVDGSLMMEISAILIATIPYQTKFILLTRPVTSASKLTCPLSQRMRCRL
ncbi:MAG: hypothetical protein AAFU54_30325, partial [Chloroflexota bacterium]